MFTGHYSAALAAKAVAPRAPLWALLIAAQFVDVLWGICVLTGIEHMRLVPTLPSNPLDLYDMPYTHSLVATVVWSGVGFLVAERALGLPRRQAVAVAVVVGSHWFLDLLVHRPDLPIVAGPLKLGLALWNYPVAAYGLEVALVAGTTWWCVRAQAVRATWRWLGFAAVLLLIQTATSFGPVPGSATSMVGSALTVYLVVAVLGRFVH